MDLGDQILSKDAWIKELQEEAGNKFNDARVRRLESEISRTKTEVREQIEKLTGDIKDRDASIRKLAKDTDLYAQALLDNDKYPKTLKDCRSNIKAANNIGYEYIRKLKKSITDLETACRSKDTKTNIQDALAAKSNEVAILQKALATKDNDLESLKSDLNRAEEQLKASETALKQVDEHLMAKQSETTGWKKRLREHDGDSAELEPSAKRLRPNPLMLWTGWAIGAGDFC